MTRRALCKGLDQLIVEGTDDRAFINALVQRRLGVDIVAPKLIKTRDDGGGASWALSEFAEQLKTPRPTARVGLVLDRDAAANDNLPRVRAQLESVAARVRDGAIHDGQFGIWMWPDNASYGDLEDLVLSMAGSSPLLEHAATSTRHARSGLTAEYRESDERKATLKVRSIWLDAARAAGYGHLVHRLDLADTPGTRSFLEWFERLFLTE
ncbi:MAG: DUF3226 domain-containing protein [Sandaracinus sp.]